MFKKIMTIICAICFLAGISLSLASCGIVAGGTTYSDAKDSVVLVVSEESLGSGFAIGEPGKPIQYIATNAHCVLNADGSKSAMQVYFSAATNTFMNAEVYWVNEEKDLAVLRLPEPTTERKAMVFCPSSKINIDEEFWALGYPAAGSFADDFRKYDKSDISTTRGGIQKQTRVLDRDVYLLDVAINHGNSGGPLVNAKGEVVGVNTFGITNTQTGDQALYAVTIDELIFSIDKRIIPYTVVGDINTQAVIILAAGVVLLLILAAVLFIVLSKKKKPSPAAAVAVPEAPAVQSVVPATAAVSAVKAYIKGVNGYFAGRNFEVGSKIIIGRDSSKCTVAFPLDSAGISGIHCEVTFDGSTAYIRDLGSSYGTFMAGGNKLAEKTPVRLNAGDRFYMASEDNTFEFTIRM